MNNSWCIHCKAQHLVDPFWINFGMFPLLIDDMIALDPGCNAELGSGVAVFGLFPKCAVPLNP